MGRQTSSSVSPGRCCSSARRKRREIADPVGDLAQPAGVADREAGGQLAASAAAAAGTAAHLPPSTTIAHRAVVWLAGVVVDADDLVAPDRHCLGHAHEVRARTRGAGTRCRPRRRHRWPAGSPPPARCARAGCRTAAAPRRRTRACRRGGVPVPSSTSDRRLDLAAQRPRPGADDDDQVEPDVARVRRVHLVAGDVPARRAARISATCSSQRHLLASGRLGGGEDGEPAAGPAHRGAGVEHPRQLLGGASS